MNRFNFFARTGNTSQPVPATHTNDHTDPYDDRMPLSPRVIPDDLEAQHTSAAAAAATEMAERSTPTTRFLHRFRPPIPSFLSSSNGHASARGPVLRPTSSAYSGEGVGGAPDTVIMGNDVSDGDDGSPKSPEFRIRDNDLRLPGTRLHLPNLARTWTQGSNGPPTRPGTAGTGQGVGGGMMAGIAEPERVAVRDRDRRGHGAEGDEHRDRRRRRRGHARDGSDGSRSSGSRSGSGSDRSHRAGRSERSRRTEGSGSQRSHRSHRSRDEESGHRRRARGERERRHGGDVELGGRAGRREHRPPKHFLFCFPWIKSRRIRSHILRCFVSGMFLITTLTVYLCLSLTKNINNNEITILLILIILGVTIFFCHSIARLCMLVVKARKRDQAAQQGQLPEMIGPSGYAVPQEPIPVVLARDEEAAGIESEATKIGPPAYGVWRESVRVDPNRFYWMRNENAPEQEESDASSSSGPASSHSGNARTNAPRPPSYSSDDGVSYVVDARPRSIAPRGNPLAGSSQPSETGRPGASWI